MTRAALAAMSAAALLLPAAAFAHVTIEPPFVEDGVEAQIAFQTPNERAPHATVSLSTTAPPGVSVISAQAPAGWRSTVNGGTVTWTGGRITGETSVAFSIRVLARVRAGTHSFLSAQGYDDGRTVKWKAGLSVLPARGAAAPAEHPWGAVAAAIGGVLVIGTSLVAVRLLRRRSLQEK